MKSFLSILILTITVGLSAQETDKIRYSFQLGTDLSIPYKHTIARFTHMEGHPQTDYHTNLGYFAEIALGYQLNERYSLYTGINYNFSRLSINDRVGVQESEGTIATSYLTIPLLGQYHFSEYAPITLSFGPYIGILLNVFEKGTTTLDTSAIEFGSDPDPVLLSIQPKYDYDKDISKNYLDFDFGLAGQIDYTFIQNDNFSLGLFTRFNFGLIDVITNDINTNSAAQKWKNYNLLLGIGFEI